MSERPRRILSLGAGVQSTTLALMAVHGETDRLDGAIFSDTQWESAAVYRHLDWLDGILTDAGIPLYRVTAGNLRTDSLSGTTGKAQIPLFVKGAGMTTAGMLRRQCTGEYKIKPIKQQLRALGATAAHPIEQWIGISLDEAARMKPSDTRYAVHRWPLIERRMTRHDCLVWLERHGYPRPPKSSCVGCPFHSDHHWRELRDTQPDAWQDAVRYDAEIRDHMSVNERAVHPVYLHRSGVPLADVDLRTPEDNGQLNLFDAECFGMCGV